MLRVVSFRVSSIYWYIMQKMMARFRELTCYAEFGVECRWCKLCFVWFGAERVLHVLMLL